MRAILVSCLVLLLVVADRPAHAAEPMVLYDDFNARHIDSTKWSAGASIAPAVLEVVREIHGNRLHLLGRTLGSTAFDFGVQEGIVRLRFANAGAVTAIQARIQVTDVDVRGCPANPAVAQTRARLSGYFFSVGNGTPGSAVNDVFAQVRLVRRSNSPDPPDVLRVEAVVLLCQDPDCFLGPTLHFSDLGPVALNEPVTARMQWDQPNHQFIFQRDGGPEVFAPYSVPDELPPSLLNNKRLELSSINVPNCTTEPGVGFVDAFFDDVYVNESAVTP